MGAAAAGSMEFLATPAVRTATELKMVAFILTQPHMCHSEQTGLGQGLYLWFGHIPFKLCQGEGLELCSQPACCVMRAQQSWCHVSPTAYVASRGC